MVYSLRVFFLVLVVSPVGFPFLHKGCHPFLPVICGKGWLEHSLLKSHPLFKTKLVCCICRLFANLETSKHEGVASIVECQLTWVIILEWEAILSADLTASSTRLAAGKMRDTRPHWEASSAVMGTPVRFISIALVITSSVSKTGSLSHWRGREGSQKTQLNHFTQWQFYARSEKVRIAKQV